MGENNKGNLHYLPPGFRFYPTDEELVVHFLHRKASLLPCHPDVIPDLDLLTFDPWDLNGKALGEGNQWYFFSRKTPERLTPNGCWKAVGIEEPVVSSASNKRVGMKKYFVFHLVGEAAAADVQTNWVMHEYRLSDAAAASTSRSSKRRPHPDYSKWVLCRVYEHNSDNDDDGGNELSCLDEIFLSLDDLDEISFPEPHALKKSYI
ncbi:NAC domain-containing protein 104 [Malania oleifera]|uniref:NAC domain-containing protein 104 n=1 Tax=Malania oleifera TaxID=397392 RepID=UPI0025AD9E4A|nr:NAC domain-containing protein 104 [Malania oleifera]